MLHTQQHCTLCAHSVLAADWRRSAVTAVSAASLLLCGLSRKSEDITPGSGKSHILDVSLRTAVSYPILYSCRSETEFS